MGSFVRGADPMEFSEKKSDVPEKSRDQPDADASLARTVSMRPLGPLGESDDVADISF